MRRIVYIGCFAHLGEDCYLIQWFRGTRKGGGKDRILQTRQRGEARHKMKRQDKGGNEEEDHGKTAGM